MKHRSALIAGVVGVVVVALIVLFVASGSESDPLAEDTNQIVGRPAPAIVGTDTEGRPFRVQDYRGRWVLLNFFGTWCIPCIEEHPQLVAFDREHSRTGDASVVSVAYNDEPQAVAEFFEERGGDWAVVNDVESDFSIDYAVVGLPESYLIDPSGRVVHKFTGGITKAEVEAEMQKRS
jgi:cytochrome c biogenesis protein CcmG/thiol:disulfide interchange protein DsbE